MRCPDFVTTWNWLFTPKISGRLAGFAWLWFIYSAAADLDFFNTVINTNTANTREAASEIVAAVSITGFTIVLFFLAFQFTVISVVRIYVNFKLGSQVASNLVDNSESAVPSTPRSDEATMSDVSMV